MCGTYAKMDEPTRRCQKNWAIFFYWCAAASFVFSHFFMYQYSTWYLMTGSFAPNRFTSTDPNIIQKIADGAGFIATTILTERIVNLVTGKALGEVGQSLGRKPLLTFALCGYLFSALFYIIGFLGNVDKTYPFPAKYTKCITAAGCAPDAKEVTKPSLICKDGDTNSSLLVMATCTLEAHAVSKDHPREHPAAGWYFLARGLIGMCAPIGVSIYAFIRDVSETDVEYGAWFGQSVGIGLLFGLFFGFLVGFAALTIAPVAFLPTCMICGAFTGLLPAVLTCIVIKEPIPPEKLKPFITKPEAKKMDWVPFDAFIAPFKLNTYTAYSYLALCVTAMASAVGESTTIAYVIYAYGFTSVDVAALLLLGYATSAINNAIIPKMIGLRRSVYLGLWSWVAGCFILGFVEGPENKSWVLIVVFFVIPLLGSSNGTGQIGLFFAQGGREMTGTLSGSWKVGEAVFKLIGGLIGLIFPAWVIARKNDPTLIPGLHYLISLPIYVIGCVLFVVADCKYGDQNTKQDEQRIVICGIKTKTADNAEITDIADKTVDA